METMIAALVYLGICGLWIVIWALVDGAANAWKRRHPVEKSAVGLMRGEF